MEFKEFNQKIKNQCKRMCDTGKLFRSSISGQQVWDTYISNFNPEDNLALIAAKQKDSLAQKSIEDLQKELENL